jgi:hypothetical protein
VTNSFIDIADIYTVQTLYDGKWRFDGTYETEQGAQKYAALLVPDWGKARVRVLVGRYDAALCKRRYFKLEMTPPLHWYQSVGQKMFSFTSRSPSQKAGPLLGGMILMIMLVGGIASFPSNAANSSPTQKVSSVAQNQVTIPKNVKQLFGDLSQKGFNKTNTLTHAPVRLHGLWSFSCPSGGRELVVSKNTITHVDGAVAQDIPLQAVFQSGQTYGFVHENGAVSVVEMVSFDQIKPVGLLGPEGQFEAAPNGELLKRCL